MAEGGGTKPKQPDQLHVHAQRVVKILEHIAECLVVTDVTAMYRVLSSIVTSLKENDEDFRKIVQNFIKLIIFKPGVSANLLKQAVRGILIIKEHPQLVNPIYDLLREKFPSFATMGRLDDETFRAYLYQLMQGYEKVKHIRLMVVGMYGVGKTCLVRKICNKNIDNVERTVGIDVSLDACKVDKEGNWVITETSLIDKEYGKRLSEIVPERKSNDQDLGNDESVRKQPSENPSPRQSQHREMDEKEAKHAFEKLEKENRSEVIEFKEDIVNNYSLVAEKKSEIENLTERGTTVSIWDFAGQSLYYSTHHFFLSSRSIYLLVLDISKDLKEKVSSNNREEKSLLRGCLPEGFTYGDAFRFWINSIYTYTKGMKRRDTGEQQQTDYDPKIVLVATHRDKLTDDDKETCKDEYFDEVLEPFDESHPIHNMICKKRFLVSCTEGTSDEFNELRKYIYNTAKEQKFWDELIPAKWIPLERTIVAHSSPFISFTELTQMDKETECPLRDETAIKSFLEFQNLLGNVLYYNVQELDKSVVLKPQWIINIFKLFITHQENIESKELRDAWKEYISKAILYPELIQYIWGKKEREHGTYDNVIEFMKHLDVIVNPVTEQKDVSGKNFFIVPCMLKKMTIDEANSATMMKLFQPNTEKTSVLGFVFENGFLPPTVFHRLLASCIREWEISFVERKNNYLLYEGFGVFKLDNQRRLTIWYAEYVIFMRITLCSGSVESLTAKDCKAVKDKISQMLKTILLLDRQKRSFAVDEEVSPLYDEYILCEKKLDKSIDYMFRNALKCGLLKVKEMKQKSHQTCHCDDHVVKSREFLQYWYPKPSDRDLAMLSDCIGEDYAYLGTVLEIESERLEEIEKDRESTTRTKGYKILIEARNKTYFTYDDLSKFVRDAHTKK